jgi:hypothetical protein
MFLYVLTPVIYSFTPLSYCQIPLISFQPTGNNQYQYFIAGNS